MAAAVACLAAAVLGAIVLWRTSSSLGSQTARFRPGPPEVGLHHRLQVETRRLDASLDGHDDR